MKEVAKKTKAKIDKEKAKLDTLVKKRDEYVAAYQAKLAEMNEGIKEQEKVVKALCEQEDAEKLDAVKEILGKKGISVDALLNAAENGDMYSIQEILEGKPAASDTSEASDSTESEATPQENYSSPTSYNF